jgi:hypothetical protein
MRRRYSGCHRYKRRENGGRERRALVLNTSGPLILGQNLRGSEGGAHKLCVSFYANTCRLEDEDSIISSISSRMYSKDVLN